jgi:hypothetical protein
MKTTKKEILNFENAIDVTIFKNNELYDLRKQEEYFIEIAYSSGINDINAQILQGATTKKLYKLTNKGNAFYILN